VDVKPRDEDLVEEQDGELASGVERGSAGGSLYAGLSLPELYRRGFPPEALLAAMPASLGGPEEFLIGLCERVVEARPCSVGPLAFLAETYTARGEYARGLEIDLRLSRLMPEDPGVLYNLACSYSLTGEVDEAVETLQEALRRGWSDLAHLERDPDMANLRRDPRYGGLVKGLAGKK